MRSSKYPSNDKLFKVDEDSPLLDANKANLFNRITVTLLYTSKRASIVIGGLSLYQGKTTN